MYIWVYISICIQDHICIYMHVCVSIYYVHMSSNVSDVVESNPKALFSLATTSKYRGGAITFLGLLHFTLDIMLSVKQGGIKYHFLRLWYDSTCNWTPVSRATGERSIHLTIWLNAWRYVHIYEYKSVNIDTLYIYIYMYMFYVYICTYIYIYIYTIEIYTPLPLYIYIYIYTIEIYTPLPA